MGAVLAAECERARKRASLGLDGELSQFGQALLRAHVGRCADCAAFTRDLGGLTREIRATPLELPQLAGVPVRRRGSGRRALQLGAAAAAVALAAGLGSLAGSHSSSQPPPRVASTQAVPKALRVAQLSVFRPQRLPGARLQVSAPA